MSHISQEQRNKPELDLIGATKSVQIQYGVISALISLLTSRITEDENIKRDEQKHKTYK